MAYHDQVTGIGDIANELVLEISGKRSHVEPDRFGDFETRVGMFCGEMRLPNDTYWHWYNLSHWVWSSTKRADCRAGQIAWAQCRNASLPEQASKRSGVTTKKLSRLTRVKRARRGHAAEAASQHHDIHLCVLLVIQRFTDVTFECCASVMRGGPSSSGLRIRKSLRGVPGRLSVRPCRADTPR
jgi:hypothetical protein